MPIIPLRLMKAKESGLISKVKASGEMNRRLRDMGLVPGTWIEVQGRAPLYDPVNIRVRGSNMALRNNEADFIDVAVER